MSVLLASCTSLPSRDPQRMLGIKQSFISADGSVQYVFCDQNGGAWGCDDVSEKTPISDMPVILPVRDSAGIALSQNVESEISPVVQSAVQPIVDNTKKVASSKNNKESLFKTAEEVGEQQIPKSEPIATVFFDFDSSVLWPETKNILDQVGSSISGKKLEVHGYTDVFGSQKYNSWLSTRRARKVAAYLESKALFLGDIDFYGHGLCCYVAPNGDKETQVVNRRVEIFVVE
jgi:outer membrane protein OmpA-like peptidoglycan-associated protein